ncbi:hypothetical protein A3I42_00185 [Candidatus Uhrbacteria bacterium RIFCSPLOWO2_02_FULL_49_11]|uniref:HicB-like antitoxin of toxin-antitoxin system domain-containing protein n=1 Tax=Candidatus Uhrbacteria bacterium RIFCSPLOWO2_02_FULL_49_11 TaxID=1802409 RepID=A0A1F7VBM4_9BACT|nr:MAG: hypothetical protein A3I42_00185 [Candidatus Uhrbacteria bacterium RIFCSPLOWO2_02_FULL_49_11]
MSFHFTTIITQEKPFYVARCVELGVVSQGATVEEATVNLKEAVELYIEDIPKEDLQQYQHRAPFVSTLELEYA